MERKILKQLDLPEYTQPLNSVIEFLDNLTYSAVKTKFPASEGLVALLEPFIDTVVICTMTALVIIIFNGDNAVFNYGGEGGVVMINGVAAEGAGITAAAFSKYIAFSGPFLTVAVVLFAISTKA